MGFFLGLDAFLINTINPQIFALFFNQVNGILEIAKTLEFHVC